MKSNPVTILRMDDVGAASKQFEQYARIRYRVLGQEIPTPAVLQLGPFKRLPGVRGWGVYNELTVSTWEQILSILRQQDAKVTVGVTAAWVNRDGTLVDFDKMYPAQASLLRSAVEEGLIEVANHGLTHCVVSNLAFLPKLYGTNRKFHREFLPALLPAIHREHIDRSQDILQRIFGEIVTFVPPGGVWNEATEQAAAAAGLKYLSAVEARAPTGQMRNGLTYIGTQVVTDFHDRDIALSGINWFGNLISTHRGTHMTIREFAATL